jgi:hypothetical protein
MKSLAHPEWPYAGTAHEWRGFVKRKWPYEGVRVRKLREGELEHVQAVVEKMKAKRLAREEAVYQKQNFGPKLD